MNTPQLTPDAYVKHKGKNCPYCTSRNVEAGNVSVHGTEASQHVKCEDCKGEWHDIFHLVRYSEISY